MSTAFAWTCEAPLSYQDCHGSLSVPDTSTQNAVDMPPGFIGSHQSVIASLISSELPFSSGAYIADARAGSALNLPGTSARSR